MAETPDRPLEQRLSIGLDVPWDRVNQEATDAIDRLTKEMGPEEASEWIALWQEVKNSLDLEGGIGGIPGGIGGAIAPFVAGIMTALAKAAPLLGKAATSAMARTMLGPVAGIATLFALFQTLKVDDQGNIDYGIAAPLLQPAQAAIRSFFEGINTLTNAQMHELQGRSFQEVQDRVGIVTAAAFEMGLAAHFLAAALSIHPLIRATGINQAVAYMADMAAFQPIARATWNRLVDSALGNPLEWHHNAEYRTNLPPFGEIMAMARKHEYASDPTDESGIPTGYDRDMAYRGISKEWVQRFWRYQWADPRLYDIIRMADTGFTQETPTDPLTISELHHYAVDPESPNWWLELKFKKAGYDRIDIPQLIQIAQNRMGATDRTRLSTQLRRALRMGYMTSEEFTAQMQALGENAGGIEYSNREATWQQWMDIGEDLQRAWERMYNQGLITEEDLRLNYTSLLTQGPLIDYKVRVQQLLREVKTASAERSDIEQAARRLQTAQLAAYKEQLQEGVIDAQTFEAQLIAVGLTPAFAAATRLTEESRLNQSARKQVSTQEKRQVEEIKDLLTRQYVAQYTAELIDDDRFHMSLIAAGHSEPAAGAIHGREWARRIKTLDAEVARREANLARDLRSRLTTQLLTQYRLAQITEETLFGSLIAAGVPESEVAAITTTEVAKKLSELQEQEDVAAQRSAAALRARVVTQLVTQRRLDIINDQSLLQGLLAIGVPDAEASAIANTEASRKIAEARDRRAREEERLAREEAEREEAASRTAAQEAIRRATALQRRTITKLQTQFREELIDQGAFLQALIAAKLPAEESRAIVDTEVAKKIGQAREEAEREAQRREEQETAEARRAQDQRDREAQRLLRQVESIAAAAERKAIAEAKAKANDLRRRLVTMLTTQYRAQLITPTALHQGLIDANVPPDEALALLETELARQGLTLLSLTLPEGTGREQPHLR